MKTVRLTMGQALVRYLIAQKTIIDGEEVPLFAGVFAIFGHGNVTCVAEALEPAQDVLPTWRGQNEQSMALAGIAAWRRGLTRLTWHVALMPLYWLLVSAAAYRALWQFVTVPFKWEKTEHGAAAARVHK